MSIYFVEFHHLDQNKWKRVSRVVESLFGYKHTSMKIKNSGEDETCFKSDFISRDTKTQEYNCMLLWMTIGYDSTRTCAEPSSLGCSLDCF
jgi:hypothetical protein